MNFKRMQSLWLSLGLMVAVLSVPQAVLAQSISDSISYEIQRKLVNTLLQQRSTKFGEYDVSLTQKTGIFGIFKSKGDMQKSNDILKQIVITDNNIFLETKKLLAIKDYESEKNLEKARQYDSQVTAYEGYLAPRKGKWSAPGQSSTDKKYGKI